MDVDTIAVLGPSLRHAAKQIAAEPEPGTCLTLFVPWQPPPLGALRCDRDDVQSFCCSASLLRGTLAHVADARGDIASLARCVVEGIAQGRAVARSLRVSQVDRPPDPGEGFATEARDFTLVMAHRGQPTHLASALAHAPRGEVLVGLDVDFEGLAAYESICARFPKVRFFQVSPNPAGPYVVRSHLISQAESSIIMFHDSDDLSCSDRADKLLPALSDYRTGIVGSHEIRLDELSRRLIAVRYPLDVNQALVTGLGLTQLHPSTVLRRQTLDRIGGFSTNYIFGADTQMLFRAFFYTTIRNVDEFLYIRRRHLQALTVRPDTGKNTPARLRVEAPWLSDFPRILSGARKLEESSLRPVHTSTQHRFERVFHVPRQ